MMFDLFDSNWVQSRWTMSLDFEEDPMSVPSRCLVLFLTLVFTSTGASYVDAQFTVEFLGKPGVYIFKEYPVSNPRHFVGRKGYWICDRLGPHTNVGEMLTAEGSMVIKLDVKIFEIGGFTDSGMDFESDLVSEWQPEVWRVISLLENDEANSDVTIVSKDRQKFFAYRWMLAGASDVFEAMFRVDMKEKKPGQVKFEDLSGNAVKVLLHYVYTGEMLPEWVRPGTVEEVVLAADKYQITKLKNYLECTLGKVCTEETAGSLLNLANRTGLKGAVPEILQFVQENIKDSDSFFRMARSSLIDYPDQDNYSANSASSLVSSCANPIADILLSPGNPNPNIGEVVRNYFPQPPHPKRKRPRRAESFSESAGSHQFPDLHSHGENLGPPPPPSNQYPGTAPPYAPVTGNHTGLPFYPVAPIMSNPDPYYGGPRPVPNYSPRWANPLPPPRNRNPRGATSSSGYGYSHGPRGQGQPPSYYYD